MGSNHFLARLVESGKEERERRTMSNLKCPGKILVTGRPWTIKFVNETTMMGLSPIVDETHCGLTFGQTLKIFIGNWTHPHLQRENVLHEVMHACAYGVSFVGELSDDLDPEEWLLSGIDSPLLTTLRDNPALVAYLCGN